MQMDEIPTKQLPQNDAVMNRRFEDVYCFFSVMLAILDGQNYSGCILFLPQLWKLKKAVSKTQL